MKTSPAMNVTLGLLAATFVAVLLFAVRVPPRSETYGNMHMMKRRMLRYAVEHGTLPTSLDQLPVIEGYTNRVTDGWGRPILWRVKGEEVTFTSYGRDGQPGGSGEDADMIGVFRAKTPDGRWSEELCPWQVDPFAPVK